MSEFQIKLANIDDLESIAPLFDLYRQFYKKESDPTAARNFIADRLRRDDSKIFLARSNTDEALGFTQLYPSFSSVTMQRLWNLNDLYVASNARKRGVGKALLDAAQDFAIQTDAASVKLATAVDNHCAKSLYESIGYKKITAFDHYTRKIDAK